MSLTGEEVLIKEEPLVDDWEDQEGPTEPEETNAEIANDDPLAAAASQDDNDPKSSGEQRILPGPLIGKLPTSYFSSRA